MPETRYPQPEPDAPQPVTVHFHGGTRAFTLLTDADLEEAGAETHEELIEKAITEPPKPHWCWIGDIYAFTQAISGFELADTVAD